MSLNNASPPADRAPGPVLVLVVDDEVPIAEALAEMVEEVGYQVVLAYQGQQALELLRQHQPSLIITDLMMPQLDGRGLIAAVRARAYPPGQPRPAIILMTAAGRAHTTHLEADAILLKPFDLEEVEQLLHQFLPAPGNGPLTR